MKNEKNAMSSENENTELVFIIDRSGSMSGFEEDTVGGFNSMIEKQKSGEGTVFVSTAFFNNHSEVIHDRVPIFEIEPLTKREYSVGGCTALLDAIGDAIHHITNVHKYARREDVPKNTVFVITTDGMENASRRYGSDKVKMMIKEKSEKYGWEFIFVAANIDAVETADKIGIPSSRAANYRQDREGFAECYEAIGSFVSMKRTRASEPILDCWKENLDD